jgi:tartrate dehydratase beta subunit/fumarate hydratase class I family protein
MSVTTAADGIKEVTTPLSDADVVSLKAGDRVRLTGIIYTARDAAHGRLLPLIEKGEKLPIDVKGAIIYYTGPTPAQPGDVSGAIGPRPPVAWTSSPRRCSSSASRARWARAIEASR